MYIEICGPDDTGDDNEDAENFDAHANKIDPVACGRFEGREAFDVAAHLPGPLAEILERHSLARTPINCNLAFPHCSLKSIMVRRPLKFVLVEQLLSEPKVATEAARSGQP
jgi:hypothetical protein